jgi:orotidine-5'-phosphate decarboxylase
MGMTQRGGEARERLIVALDYDSRDKALRLVESLDGLVSFYKVGLQLFVAEGMKLVEELIAGGHRVFLDLKMDDVDETIASAVAGVTKGRAHFLTLLGGAATMRAGRKGRGEAEFPKLLSVTLLSSLNETDLREQGLLREGSPLPTLDAYVLDRAGKALGAGADGLIASGQTIGHVRGKFGAAPLIISPGIRPTNAASNEHKRSTTPKQALQWGADYLVVGRPIRGAVSPRGAAEAIVEEMEVALG